PAPDRPAATPPAAGTNVPLLICIVVGGVLLIGGGLVGAFLWLRDKGPPGSKYLDARDRARTNNNLKQVMLALQSYHDSYGQFPPPVIREPGKPPRSWRVEVLPFIEQNNLYQVWRKDLPFDSPENRALWGSMPATYALPGE